MSILILVLKILGIAILAILALVLLLVCYVLFVPLRYAAGGEHYDALAFLGDVHDLLHIVCVSFSYKEKQSDLAIKIFGFNIKKNRGDYDEQEDTSQEAYTEPDNIDTHDAEKESDESDRASDTDNVRVIDEEAPTPESSSEYEYTSEDELSEDGFESEDDFTDDELDEMLESDEFTDDDSEGIAAKIEYIYKIVTDERNKRAFVFILSEGWSVLKRLAPSVKECDLTFSAGSCDLTGELTGAISMLPFAYGRKTSIIPDFSSDDPYCRGNAVLKGKIPLFPIGIFAARVLFFNKDCRRLIHKIRS